MRVEAYGLKARLGGDVTVSTVPDDVARGNGTIKVVEGQYKAFGQDVRITKGLLTYVNTPLSEPMLDIVAERKIKDADITVAVNVRGTLDQPYISITSTPAMSEQRSAVVPADGALDRHAAVGRGGQRQPGRGEPRGQRRRAAARRARHPARARRSVRREDGRRHGYPVVLGKFLSPKLFVSYGISIAEAINTIKLRYTLNEHWSLKAEAGLEQSADIEYRIER